MQQPARILLPLPFYRWETWASERWNNLSKDYTSSKWQKQNSTLKSIRCYLTINTSELGSFPLHFIILNVANNIPIKPTLVTSISPDWELNSMISQNILWPIVMWAFMCSLSPNPTMTPSTPTLDYSQFLKHHLTSFTSNSLPFPSSW